MMKFINYKLLLGLVLLASCSKKLDVSTPEFDVTTASSTYKAGEAVKFTFSGNPQMISVYTGEVGKDYAFKDGRVMDAKEIRLVFNSSVTNGAGTGTPQTGMFSLMASTDFNGDYSNFASVQAATWTDITNRMTKQEAATTATITVATPAAVAATTTSPAIPAGINVADLRVEGKPLYIAYKYNVREVVPNGIWRDWRFQGFTLTAITDAGAIVLGNMTTTVFKVVLKNPEIVSRTTATTSTLTLQHADVALYPTTQQTPTQNWIITQAFNVHKINHGPDYSTPIQGGLSADQKKDFTYTFAKPGTYRVSFVGANVNASDKKEVLKHIDLVITP